MRFRTEFRNYGKKKDFGKTIPRKYQQHKLEEWSDLTFITKGIYSSMQRNKKCFAANLLDDAAKDVTTSLRIDFIIQRNNL